MTDRAEEGPRNDPVALHRIMQSMIGEALKERYRPPQKLSHELFVVLLQLKEEERRKTRAARLPRSSARLEPQAERV